MHHHATRAAASPDVLGALPSEHLCHLDHLAGQLLQATFRLLTPTACFVRVQDVCVCCLPHACSAAAGACTFAARLLPASLPAPSAIHAWAAWDSLAAFQRGAVYTLTLPSAVTRNPRLRGRSPRSLSRDVETSLSVSRLPLVSAAPPTCQPAWYRASRYDSLFS